MDKQYKCLDLGDNCRTIEDDGVRCFLFEGSEKALLVDTGHGTVDLCAFVSGLTSLPILLVNTHADRDHIGGNKGFGWAYMHPDDRDRLMEKDGDAGSLKPIEKGQVIDIGGRVFRVVHIPGHTPGSIALFDERSGGLVAGDTVQNGRVFMFGPGRNMPDYLQSLKKLMALPVKRVYASHGGAMLKPQFIQRLFEDAKDVEEGRLQGVDTEVFGMPVKEFRGAAGYFLCDRET